MPGSSRSTAPDEARIAILQHLRGRKKCMFNAIRRDIRAALERDPASRNAREGLLCYPGLHALWFYRVAHRVWRRGGGGTARFISHLGRFFTWIEIHPRAVIGPRLFIYPRLGL